MRLSPITFPLLMLSLIVGCSGGSDDVETYPATGTVTLDGTALPSASIVMFPTGEGPAPTAESGADGTFVVKTGRLEGAPAGEYKVVVMAGADEELSSENPSTATPKGSLVPEKYTSQETTDLKVTIKEGDNDLPLELKSK